MSAAASVEVLHENKKNYTCILKMIIFSVFLYSSYEGFGVGCGVGCGVGAFVVVAVVVGVGAGVGAVVAGGTGVGIAVAATHACTLHGSDCDSKPHGKPVPVAGVVTVENIFNFILHINVETTNKTIATTRHILFKNEPLRNAVRRPPLHVAVQGLQADHIDKTQSRGHAIVPHACISLSVGHMLPLDVIIRVRVCEPVSHDNVQLFCTVRTRHQSKCKHTHKKKTRQNAATITLSTYALHVDHCETTHEHGPRSHAIVSVSVGHAAPPYDGIVVTVRVRVATPGPLCRQ